MNLNRFAVFASLKRRWMIFDRETAAATLDSVPEAEFSFVAYGFLIPAYLLLDPLNFPFDEQNSYRTMLSDLGCRTMDGGRQRFHVWK